MQANAIMSSFLFSLKIAFVCFLLKLDYLICVLISSKEVLTHESFQKAILVCQDLLLRG